MKQVNIWNNISNPKLIRYYTEIEPILDYIRKNKKMSFFVLEDNGLEDGKIPTLFISQFNDQAKKVEKEIIYFDEKHPAFIDGYENLCFSKKFYSKYEYEIKQAVEDVLFSSDNVYVNKYMYSDDLAKSLVITAKTIRFENGINIPDKIIKIYEDNHVNAYFENEKQISSDMILGCQYEDVISDSKYITIEDDIKDLENLIYIPSHKEIFIKLTANDTFEEDYDKMYEIISTLRKNGQNNKVTIEVNNRNKFLKSKLHDSNFDIVINGLDNDPYTLKELVAEDKLIDKMVEEISYGNYSPYEKYIACYNIVKRFKKYNENENNKSDARRVRKLLNNDYMVCAGYANFLELLLTRVGFSVYCYRVSTDISYDEGYSMKEIPVSLESHVRLIVNIEDPKYNIHGFYVSDPTWDNDLEEDYYNHALMSFDKTTKEDRYFKLESEDLIMNVRSMEEFSYKVNFLLNRERKNNPQKNLTYKEKERKAYQKVISCVLQILSYLMPQKYLELKKRYANIVEFKDNYDEANRFLTEAGYIFINNLGYDTSIDTTINAAGEVNKKVFGFDEKYNNENFYEYKRELLEKNAKRDKEQFPYYYNDTKLFLNEHLEDVINIFKESFLELPDAIESLSEKNKEAIIKEPYLKDFLSLTPEEAFGYGGCFLFAKIINNVLPNTKFVVEYNDKENRPSHILLRNDEVCFDISYKESKKEESLISNKKCIDASLKDLLYAEENFYNPQSEVYDLLESIFKSNLRNYLSVAMEFENENKNKHN